MREEFIAIIALLVTASLLYFCGWIWFNVLKLSEKRRKAHQRAKTTRSSHPIDKQKSSRKVDFGATANSSTRESFSFQSERSPAHEMNEEKRFALAKCPLCNRDLRIPLPPPGMNGTCKGCSGRFRLSIEQGGELHLSRYGEQHADPEIQSYFDILGINLEATGDEIKAAYRKAISEYHPDKTAHLGKDLQQLAENKTREIIRAYDKLRSLGHAE